LAGYWAGQFVESLSRTFDNAPSRNVLAFGVAAVLFLVLAAGVFPLAREGMFALESQFRGALLMKAFLFCTGWALAFIAFSSEQSDVAEGGTSVETHMSRRAALHNVAAAGLAVGVAWLGWRLAKAPDAGDSVAQRQAAADIAARAREGTPEP